MGIRVERSRTRAWGPRFGGLIPEGSVVTVDMAGLWCCPQCGCPIDIEIENEGDILECPECWVRFECFLRDRYEFYLGKRVKTLYWRVLSHPNNRLRMLLLSEDL